MDKKKLILVIACAAVALAIVILIVVVSGKKHAQKVQEQAAVQAGVDYLQQLEAQSTQEVEETLKEQRRQERIKLLETGELSVWDQMEDAVIMGDSRAVGFSYYGFIDASRVLAEGGATIANIPDYLDTLKTLNPASIFLCYGLNDVSIGYWNTTQEYVDALDEQMQAIWKELPDVQIYVSSILIARDPAFERASAWRNIPDFNTAIAAFCEQKGYSYVDNTDLCDTYADLWDVDGIHVQEAFYPHWATNLVAETYRQDT